MLAQISERDVAIEDDGMEDDEGAGDWDSRIGRSYGGGFAGVGCSAGSGAGFDIGHNDNPADAADDNTHLRIEDRACGSGDLRQSLRDLWRPELHELPGGTGSADANESGRRRDSGNILASVRCPVFAEPWSRGGLPLRRWNNAGIGQPLRQ